MPKLRYQDTEYLDAYYCLDRSRSSGVNGPNPIGVPDMSSLCTLLGIASTSQKSKYLRIVQKLDRVYLDHWYETHQSK